METGNYNRLKTLDRLVQNTILLGDDSALKTYEAFMVSQSSFKFAYYGALVSANPITDWIHAQQCNRMFRRLIDRYFYRSKDYLSPLKMMFFIEPHKNMHKRQYKIHSHFLLSEITDVSHNERDPMKFEEPYRLAFVHSALTSIARKIGFNKINDNESKEGLKRIYFQYPSSLLQTDRLS